MSLNQFPFLRKTNIGSFHISVPSVTIVFIDLKAPLGHMCFAPMAASSRIDRGYHNVSKTISFWPFLLQGMNLYLSFKIASQVNDQYQISIWEIFVVSSVETFRISFLVRFSALYEKAWFVTVFCLGMESQPIYHICKLYLFAAFHRIIESQSVGQLGLALYFDCQQFMIYISPYSAVYCF